MKKETLQPEFSDGQVIRFWRDGEITTAYVNLRSSYQNNDGVWQYVLVNPKTGHDICRGSMAELKPLMVRE